MATLIALLDEDIAAAPPLRQGEQHPSLAAVQSFLERYGYLRPGTARPGWLDESTADAIRLYQRFRKMDETGELDVATRERMSQPRCGNPDVSRGLPFRTVCASESLILTFTFLKGTPDVPDFSAFDAVRRAFGTWAATGNFYFRQVPADTNADIHVAWLAPGDPGYNLPGSALAVANYPCSKPSDQPYQILHFNDDRINWGLFDYSPFKIDIETVALHEIGHLIGLGHSEIQAAVMWPDYPWTERRALQADDLAALTSLYGPMPAHMATSVIFEVRQHFGDEPGSLPGEFAGQSKEYSFACPRVDGTRSGVLLFQAKGVSTERNLLTINGWPVFGDVPRTADDEGWAGQVLLIRPGVLKPVDNVLKIESRTAEGTTSGNLDDFVIDNATVLYETITAGIGPPVKTGAPPVLTSD